MYVTRPLSLYKRDPAALSLPPPEGPNSGYLVLLDEESVTTCCFGFCTDTRIRHLPFPQNKNLTITYTESSGESSVTYVDKVLFVPVLNQPLSNNQYYVIRRQGKHQGEASASSTEEDKGSFLCCSYIRDVKPKSFEQSDPYQQFEIIRKRCGFHAKPVGTDGYPPRFLRRKGWNVYYKTPDHYHLGEALGLNASLRARMPDFNFPLANHRSHSAFIGKWYCPFIFVKEGLKLKDQMKMSSFYEMTLEQRWDEIFGQDNTNFGKAAVPVDVNVEREVVKLGGKAEAVTRTVGDGFLWFQSLDRVGGEGNEASVGLSMAIVERMQWEQKRGGWVSGNEREVRIERAEEYGGIGEWKRFGCYVLVESFVLKRMDGSVVLIYEFKHTHQIRCKWE